MVAGCIFQRADVSLTSDDVELIGHTRTKQWWEIRSSSNQSPKTLTYKTWLQVLVYGDCAVNTDPSPEELAKIGVTSADTAAAFGIEPLVAFLSYSTLGSGAGPDVDKVGNGDPHIRARSLSLLLNSSGRAPSSLSRT